LENRNISKICLGKIEIFWKFARAKSKLLDLGPRPHQISNPIDATDHIYTHCTFFCQKI